MLKKLETYLANTDFPEVTEFYALYCCISEREYNEAKIKNKVEFERFESICKAKFWQRLLDPTCKNSRGLIFYGTNVFGFGTSSVDIAPEVTIVNDLAQI